MPSIDGSAGARREKTMYGTVARLRMRAGQEARLHEAMTNMESRPVDGYVASYVYRLDDDPRNLMLAVLFRDRESYRRNADDPRQDEEYQALRALLESDPEWHDGEVIWSSATA
jgi:hypothetical protein